MNSLKELNDARRAETNQITAHQLYVAEQALRVAIKLFGKEHSAENMKLLNGAWVVAANAFAKRTPTGPESPVGGAVEWRKAA